MPRINERQFDEEERKSQEEILATPSQIEKERRKEYSINWEEVHAALQRFKEALEDAGTELIALRRDLEAVERQLKEAKEN